MDNEPRLATPDLDRIQVDPGIMAGHPVVKDTRVPVSVILNVLAHGYSPERVVEEYPSLTLDDVRAALYFASLVVEQHGHDPMDDDPDQIEWLRAELQIGSDQIERGDLIDYTPDLLDVLTREAEANARH